MRRYPWTGEIKKGQLKLQLDGAGADYDEVFTNYHEEGETPRLGWHHDCIRAADGSPAFYGAAVPLPWEPARKIEEHSWEDMHCRAEVELLVSVAVPAQASGPATSGYWVQTSWQEGWRAAWTACMWWILA